MDENPSSLKALFAAAEEKRLALESSHIPPQSPAYVDSVLDAIQSYRACGSLVSALALFSPNETLDDLATSDLPFLLIPYHLGELAQRLPSPGGPRDRRRLLAAAREAYERYLHLADGYGLLSAPHKKLLERYADDPARFAVALPTSDPAARREAKIAGFRAERELRAKLDFLRRRPEYADPDSSGGGGGDEEAVRQVHLANLDFCTHMAFQALEGLNRELDVLAQAPEVDERPGATAQAEDDARRRRGVAVANGGYDDRLDEPLRRGPGGGSMGGPLLTKQGKPLQPFTLLGSRQELANGVFRPGHNLPTMTIDEYLEEERRRGGIIEGGGEASGIRPEPDEDNVELADAETMKAREWDEFKEANHRGSGNTLNRG